MIWTIQIKLDGAESDAFLPANVIRVDFLDFYLFVVTNDDGSLTSSVFVGREQCFMFFAVLPRNSAQIKFAR